MAIAYDAHMTNTAFWTPAVIWLVLAALASASLLAGAHAFEYFGHYPPCELCYTQRDVHWIALALALVGLIASPFHPGVARSAAFVVGLAFLVSFAVAGYHAGIEWKWWPGPSSCTGAHVKAITAADMASLLGRSTTHIVRCDEAAWRMFGISMAGYNAVVSLVLAVISFAVVSRKTARG